MREEGFMKKSRKVRTESSIIGDIVIWLILILLAIIMIYPVLYMFSISLSDSRAVSRGLVKLFPVGFSLDAYLFVLRDPRVGLSYWNTIVYATLFCICSLLFTSLTAYPLSIQSFSLRNILTILYAITMFFGGGLIPYYITLKMLGMINSIWVMIIPGCVSVWNMIIYRTFFSNIPSSLRESAFIDGANDVTILFRIIIPLSKPLLATMALFAIVGKWNDYFGAMIFLTDAQKYPLQMILRSLVMQIDVSTKETAQLMAQYNVVTSTIRAATIVVAMLPIMCIYPFLQKYFAHGIMIGSIKG